MATRRDALHFEPKSLKSLLLPFGYERPVKLFGLVAVGDVELLEIRRVGVEKRFMPERRGVSLSREIEHVSSFVGTYKALSQDPK